MSLGPLKDIHPLVGEVDPDQVLGIALIPLQVHPSGFDFLRVVMVLRPGQGVVPGVLAGDHVEEFLLGDPMVVEVIVVFQGDGAFRGDPLVAAILCGVGENELNLGGEGHVLGVGVGMGELGDIRAQNNVLGVHQFPIYVPVGRAGLACLRILHLGGDDQGLPRRQGISALKGCGGVGDAIVREVFQGELVFRGNFLFPSVLGGIGQTIGDGAGLWHPIVVVILIGEGGGPFSQGQGLGGDLLAIHIPGAGTHLPRLWGVHGGGGGQRLPGGQNLGQGDCDLRICQPQVLKGLQLNGGRGFLGEVVSVMVGVGEDKLHRSVQVQVVGVVGDESGDGFRVLPQNEGGLFHGLPVEIPGAGAPLAHVGLGEVQMGGGGQGLSGVQVLWDVQVDGDVMDIIVLPTDQAVFGDGEGVVSGLQGDFGDPAAAADGIVPAGQ